MVKLSFSKKTLLRLEKGKGSINETAKDVNVDLQLKPLEQQYLHTIVLYDESAPFPSTPSSSPFIHWIVSDIKGNDVETGKTVFKYAPPNPPSSSPPHVYVLFVLRQLYPLEFNYRDYKRANFPLNEFAQANNLKIVDSATISLGKKNNKPNKRENVNLDRNYSLSGSDLSDLSDFSDESFSDNVSNLSDMSNDLSDFSDFSEGSDISNDINSSAESLSNESLDMGGRRYPVKSGPRHGSPLLNTRSHSVNSRTHRYAPPKLMPPYKQGTPIKGQEKKFCDCIQEVGERKTASGKGPYNPFAVCAKSTGTTSRRCSQYYDFDRMSDDELQAYLRTHKVKLPGKFNRIAALNAIHGKLGK